VVLLLIANTLNIAADVAAMGDVAERVTGHGSHGRRGGLDVRPVLTRRGTLTID
jgi:hypothetical protein